MVTSSFLKEGVRREIEFSSFPAALREKLVRRMREVREGGREGMVCENRTPSFSLVRVGGRLLIG